MANDVFKPMRSCKIEPQYPMSFPKLVSYKLDGIRMAKFDGKDRTKSGKPVPNKSVSNWIKVYLPDGFDTEMLIGKPNDPAVYARTYSAVMSHEGSPDVTFYAFDTCDDLVSLKMARLERLKATWAMLPQEIQDRVVLVEHFLVHTQEELDAMYVQAIALGYEGLIISDPVGQYKWGKCSPKQQTQLKMKPDEDEEAEITGIYEGETNENEAYTNEVGETRRSTHQENKVGNGRAGGFNCIKNGLDFKVGPGKFTHAELKDIWAKHLAEPAYYPGRFLKYAHLGYGDMANGRPRHPRAIGFRDAVDMEATCQKE